MTAKCKLGLVTEKVEWVWNLGGEFCKQFQTVHADQNGAGQRPARRDVGEGKKAMRECLKRSAARREMRCGRLVIAGTRLDFGPPNAIGYSGKRVTI